MRNHLVWIKLLPLLLLMFPLVSAAGIPQTGFETGKAGASVATYKRGLLAKRAAAVGEKALGGETLQGELAGNWDFVTGVLAFPYTSEDGLDLYQVALTLPGESLGNQRYAVAGWQREAFFLDTGDGVPRLMSAELIDPAFVPEPQDALFESGQLWLVTYVPYQEIEELERNPDFYADYPGAASNADVRFVTDDAGEVLQVAIDIFDSFDEYQYSVEPVIGDRFNLGFKGYDLAEPDIFYIRYYFDQPIAITDEVSIERRYYVPDGSSDTALPQAFDAADLELFLILEGVAEDTAGEASFAYNTPSPLGYTWGEAKSSPAASSGSSGVVSPLLSLMLIVLLLNRRRQSMPRIR